MSEIAKALPQTAVQTTRDFRGFVSLLFGPATDGAAGSIRDQFQHWRFKNAMSLIDKVEDFHRARGLGSQDVRAIPFGDAFKTFSAASEEDDDGVQDLWAALLANVSDPNSDAAVQKVHVDLLKSISGIEAAVLQVFAIKHQKRGVLARDDIVFLDPFPDIELEIAIENLTRLRCIAAVPHARRNSPSFLPARISGAGDTERWMRDRSKRTNQTVGEGNREVENVNGGSSQSLSKGAVIDHALTALGHSLVEACRSD